MDLDTHVREKHGKAAAFDINHAPPAAPIKALPTFRLHTTDQLDHEQDEFVPKDYDELGERKVSPLGETLGGRAYNIRTFSVAHRGEERFMLATECASGLGYQDSYLFLNQNRSLHRIIATPQEKDDLISQEIIPYSYRSRQVLLVTAKSMFRQFGARVIQGGRRVRDDYWEAKTIAQGFTGEDTARDALLTAEAMGLPSAENPFSFKTDYQMQMGLLDQSDKKRLLMTRQEQNTISTENPFSESSHAPRRGTQKVLDSASKGPGRSFGK